MELGAIRNAEIDFIRIREDLALELEHSVGYQEET